MVAGTHHPTRREAVRCCRRRVSDDLVAVIGKSDLQHSLHTGTRGRPSVSARSSTGSRRFASRRARSCPQARRRGGRTAWVRSAAADTSQWRAEARIEGRSRGSCAGALDDDRRPESYGRFSTPVESWKSMRLAITRCRDLILERGHPSQICEHLDKAHANAIPPSGRM